MGQQGSFGPPAQSKGEVILVHHQDHEDSNGDMGLGSEIQVHLKKSEVLESWTSVSKFADNSQMHKADGIQDQVRHSRDKVTEKGKKKVTPERKKELPLHLEKIVQFLSKSSSNWTNALQSRGAKKMARIKESEEEEKKKNKGKNIPNRNLTLPMHHEEVTNTPRRVIGSPTINQRSETYIKSRKEAMSMDTKN